MQKESVFKMYFTVTSDTNAFDSDLLETGFSEIPTIRRKGDRLANNQIVRINQICFIRENISGTSLVDSFHNFVDFLEMNQPTIQVCLAVEGASASLDIVGDFIVNSPRPTFFFSARAIKVLASLNCNFNIEIYSTLE